MDFYILLVSAGLTCTGSPSELSAPCHVYWSLDVTGPGSFHRVSTFTLTFTARCGGCVGTRGMERHRVTRCLNFARTCIDREIGNGETVSAGSMSTLTTLSNAANHSLVVRLTHLAGRALHRPMSRATSITSRLRGIVNEGVRMRGTTCQSSGGHTRSNHDRSLS